MLFLPAGASVLRPRDKISGLPNPEQSQLPPTNPYPGRTTSNCKQPYSMLTGAQYQTSYLPNIPAYSNKEEGKGERKREGTSVSTGEVAVSGPVNNSCSWRAKRRPPFSQNPPQRKRYSWRHMRGFKTRFVKGFDLHAWPIWTKLQLGWGYGVPILCSAYCLETAHSCHKASA
jgi:hypothetical protein